MVTEFRVYFEGDKALRPGFHEFLGEIRDLARSKRIKFGLVAAGGNPTQFFAKAQRANVNAWNILLLDSDSPLTPESAIQHGLTGVPAEQVHWMVQVMESWFLGDPDKLQEYYGADFNRNALSNNRNVEQIAKMDVMSALKNATKSTQKGQYHKTDHAPNILGCIRPKEVRAAAPNCERLFQLALAKLAEA